jgi:Ca2+-binding RTX toxin-like protein
MAIINDAFGNSNRALYGTEEVDVINAFDGNDRVTGNGGGDFIFGGSGDDLLYGDDIESTALDDDFMDGGLGNDTLAGGYGNDRLVDLFGNNVLSGNAGDDTLIAGVGDDVLIGSIGNNLVTGGLGRDRFHLSRGGHAMITDFNINDDKIIVPVKNLRDFASVATDALAETSANLLVYSRGTGSIFLNANGGNPGFGDGGKLATLLGAPQNLSSTSFEAEIG